MSTTALVETYFDPDDGLEGRVAEEIGRAKTSIWIQAYKFSSETIVDTILRLKRERPDLDVRLSLDAREAHSTRDKKQGRLVEAIAESGGEVRYVSDADKSHSKFIVIDSEVVLTGSFNFKRHADRVQRDNMVVIRNRDVARTYASRFEETVTTEHAAGARRGAEARRSRPSDGAAPNPISDRPSDALPEGSSDTPEAAPETAAAAPDTWLRWGGRLLESGRALVLGFGLVLLAGLGLGILAAMAFAELVDGVMDQDTALLDQGLQAGIAALRSPELDTFAHAASFMGAEAIWVLAALTIGMLVRQRRLGAVGALLLAVGGAQLVNGALKMLYQRDRPTTVLTDLPGQVWSFPSGHAMVALAFYGFVAYLAWRLLRGAGRVAAVTLLVAVVGLVGLSRVYLGVHYPTDVLAGYLAGFIWLDAVLIGSQLLPRLGVRRRAVTSPHPRALERESTPGHPDSRGLSGAPPAQLGTGAGRAWSDMGKSLAAATVALVLLLGAFGGAWLEQTLDADAAFEFNGIVEALPADGLVGTWQVGGRTVQVSDATEIERTASSPAIGVRVAVEGIVLDDQSISASEIELGDEDD